MAHFYTRKESEQRAKIEKQRRREDRLRHKDLMWAAKRRYLNNEEWYELHVLDRTYGQWGPEQAEYEFGVLSELREYYARNSVGSKCPTLNALQKHLAMHQERETGRKKAIKKKSVNPEPPKASRRKSI